MYTHTFQNESYDSLNRAPNEMTVSDIKQFLKFLPRELRLQKGRKSELVAAVKKGLSATILNGLEQSGKFTAGSFESSPL